MPCTIRVPDPSQLRLRPRPLPWLHLKHFVEKGLLWFKMLNMEIKLTEALWL